MKILIADDQTIRYKSLIQKIIAKGIPRENISLVSSAKEAQDRLSDVNFDLFILDILLPLWSEDYGDSGRFSQDILLSLYNSDEYKKPRTIIGITGDKSTVTNELVNFESHLLGVVENSSSCSEWEDKIIHIIDYISDSQNEVNKKQTNNEVIDLAIICALKEPELSEILKLDWSWQEAKPLNDKLFYRKGNFISKGKSYSVVVANCERMGMVSSTLTSSAIIHEFSPKVIAMTGICAGIKGKVELGDIIFASLVWDYQNGKRLESGEHELDPHQVAASPCIKAHAELLEENKGFFKNLVLNYNDEKSNIINIPKLHIGPIAVGSSVLADQGIVNEIKSQNRKVLGIEMEIYGVYYTAINSPSPAPKVFAIKSVCDFADSEKNNNFQQYASYTSANTLKELVEKYASNLIQ
ncbi:hypothetical protein CTM70_19140 [Photobacterium phosphoreum]|uniref:phosphorylase family protein n=1 Tax=Photobacterium phosphoreum TaxID=659 RepID=UPI000D1511BB|nr:hypothetical protein [Photobacterium phosphoreum]PSW33992.1 hypothetical protein CTM70_19140 [Photobacterium phosphoreum]